MDELDSFPPGYHSVNPYLVVGNILEFIKFSELVFDAAVVKLITEEKGKYAEIRVGDTLIMMEENHKISHHTSPSLWAYVKDVDATYYKALKAGCKSIQAPTYKYAVDKVAKVMDQFGIMWLLATFNDDV